MGNMLQKKHTVLGTRFMTVAHCGVYCGHPMPSLMLFFINSIITEPGNANEMIFFNNHTF